MPDTTSSTDPDKNDTEKKSGGAKRLVIVGAICVVILGMGYVLGGRMAAGGAAGEAITTGTEPEVPESETIASIVSLDAVNVNLAGGHYLRIAVSLGLGLEEDPATAGGHEDGGAEFPTAPVADLVLSTFAGREIETLATPTGREAARQDLLAGIDEFYGETIATVFFTEFVMQ